MNHELLNTLWEQAFKFANMKGISNFERDEMTKRLFATAVVFKCLNQCQESKTSEVIRQDIAKTFEMELQ